MVPLFYTWNLFSIYGSAIPHIKMVPLFDIWFSFSQTGTGIQNVVLLFYQSKGYIKGSRAYRNWQKGSGLIFFWCTFSFMVSPPAFFSIFKIKNRRKESGKEADKKHLRKQVPQFPYHQFSKIGFPNSSFNISASQIFNRPDPPDQFFKIANHKNQFQKFCGLIFLRQFSSLHF